MKTSNPSAILPLVLFLGIFVGSGLFYTLQGVEKAFYQIAATVAILPAIAVALFLGRDSFAENISTFIEGVRDKNIITMCLIYLMAGAFAATTAGIGSVDATVNLGLSLVPGPFLLPGIFLITAALATAMGTSMGVIATVGPLAFALATKTELDGLWTMGAVVGGAMFGDNLSLISDTTIASVQTQGAKFKEKFMMNALIAVPAMILTVCILYAVSPSNLTFIIEDANWTLVLPYAVIFVLALMGMNVMAVLGVGIALAGLMGLLTDGTGEEGAYSLAVFASHIQAGFLSMHDILILSLLIGGLSFMTSQQGGLTFLIEGVETLALKVRNKKKSTRIGEMSIAVIGSLADFCTANNTVAIILSGGLAKDLAKKHGVSKEKSACLLDIFTCVFQGLLPYSAQILLASSIAGYSPLEIIPYVLYCPTLGLMAIFAIMFKTPKMQ